MSQINRKELVSSWFKNLQESIIRQLELEDGGGKFDRTVWNRDGGGGGITRLMVNGNVIEKGGVNFSAVFGQTPKPIQNLFSSKASEFFASGVSIVIHPENPFVPIIHMNVRYFELTDGRSWFGGGIDLTPAYVFQEDGVFFHQSLKKVCDRFQSFYYQDFKDKADNYFFIRHRNEMRGIGGIFYDRLDASGAMEFAQLWEFTKAVGELFCPVYTEIIKRRKGQEWTEANKQWQLHRRSRYVEFNLVYDSGTKFGLETNGRTESILMSMPPLARWETDYAPKPETQEAKSQEYFTRGRRWV